MMRSVLSQLCFLLVLNSISAELTISSSCPSHCGKISIPYPFGIGNGCYHNEWYEVQCNNFVPFLPKISKEVVQIDYPRPSEHGVESIPSGSLRIKTKITSMGCSGGDGKEFKEVLNYTKTPFSMSSNNKLVAFGCNHKATLMHVDPRIVGCVSTCDPSNLLTDSSERGCDGYKCCNVSTPIEVGQEIGVKIESRDGGNTTTGGCAVAFLTDEFDQTSRSWGNRADPKWFHARKYSTIQLKWKVITMGTSFTESLKCGNNTLSDDFLSRPCYCYEVVTDDEAIHLWCACTSGYKGNPYLLDDCKDIDECKILEAGRHRPKYCSSGETCLNTRGGHQCVVKKNKTFLIYIGVSIGVSVFLVCACIWLYKYIKKQRKIKQRQAFFKRNGGLLLQQQLTSGEGSVDKTVVFSSKELEKATESFSSERVLGEGGQGTVYKGMLADGRIVAVKKSKALDQDQVQEFINELVILSQINHRNIVSILGCCLETEVPVLVYEFISNGNLFEHLQNQVDDDQTVASWEVRLRIAIDIADSLSYLHSAASSPIYHKDVKSTNIMLDAKHRAKLSDFGISRVMAVDDTHLTTVVKGTAGYVDPEYYQSEQYTEKSDVYSYGVVLAELITGEKPVSSQRPQNTRTLATYFLVAMRDDRLFDIIDPRIRDGCMLEQVKVMAKIARLCLNLTGERRPSMRDILVELECIRSSPHGVSLHLGCIVENDEEDDQAVEVISRRETFNIDIASTSAYQYDYGAAMSTDVEPLCPSQTW